MPPFSASAGSGDMFGEHASSKGREKEMYSDAEELEKTMVLHFYRPSSCIFIDHRLVTFRS